MAEVPTEGLRFKDSRLLSPPQVGAPLYQCATAIVVYGFDVGAKLDVRRNGTIVLAAVPGGFPQPSGALLALPAPLVAGDVIRARQKSAGMTSAWSSAVTVRDHTQDFPDGPPRPVTTAHPRGRSRTNTTLGAMRPPPDAYSAAVLCSLVIPSGCRRMPSRLATGTNRRRGRTRDPGWRQE